MKKLTIVAFLSTRLNTPHQATFTTNRFFEVITSRKDDRYSTQIFTKKFDTSTKTNFFDKTEMEPKTKFLKTKTIEITVTDEKTSASPAYKMTITPNQVIVRKF